MIIDKIEALKARRDAVILAHNYQPAEIQDLADYAGDSLGLSLQASKTDARVIVFCGVRFMAETAAILSPDKTVLLPDEHAGCPMADMIDADQLRTLKQEHPDALVVCYVNSTAEVKAQSDYCCTSANAVELVRSLPEGRPVLFVPDQNLGRYAARQTGRDLILWPGYCRSHVLIDEQDVRDRRDRFPDAILMAHPECTDPVKDLADLVLSTGQMLKYAGEHEPQTFLIATETGIIHALEKANPRGTYIPVSENAVCENMKKITLEKVLWALESMQYPVTVEPDIAESARKALGRMIEVLPAS